MRARDVGALLLTDPINIRYVTGVSVMPLWSATNLAHYVLVPAEGSPVVFEYSRAKFRAEEFFSDVRNAHYWQARFAEGMAAERSGEWAAEIKDALGGWGVGDARLGVDSPGLPRLLGAPGTGDSTHGCRRPGGSGTRDQDLRRDRTPQTVRGRL